MALQAQKLELVEMLVHTNNSAVLEKVKALLIANGPAKKPQDETEYLLSTEANRRHLMESIDQLNRGEGTSIKTEDLWK